MSGDPRGSGVRSLFGRMAIARRLITEAQLDEVLAEQKTEANPRRLGEMLVAKGYMSAADVDHLLRLQQTRFRRGGPGAPALAFGVRKGEAFGDFVVVRELGVDPCSAVFEVARGDEQFALRFFDGGVSRQFGADIERAWSVLMTAKDRPPAVPLGFAQDRRDGVLWQVVEWCPGGTLRDIVGRRRLSADKALEIAIAVGEALAFGWRSGVRHGMLSASQVRYRAGGGVCLDGWGLGARGWPLDGSVPPEAAPEQLGHGGPVDSRADVYGLGALVYEMVTGGGLYEGRGDDTVESIRHAVPTRLRKVVDDAPSGLEAVVMQALRKDAIDRYESVGRMVADLRRVAAGERVQASPLAASRRIFGWFKRLRRDV